MSNLGGRQTPGGSQGPFELHNELDLLGPAAPSGAVSQQHVWGHGATPRAAAAAAAGHSIPATPLAAPQNPAMARLNSSGPTRQQSLLGTMGSGALTGWGGQDEHPMDMPADGAAAPGGRRAAEVGVHGADKHEPEDDEMRTVQVQTLGGEGVLTGWRLLLKLLGYRKRRSPGMFPSNELITSKYTLLTFLPRNLYEQFRRVANMYFLLLVCLQAIPGLSPVPWWGTLFPLAVVLTVNGIKEAADDYWRHKADEEVNHRMVTTLKEDGDQLIQWKQLQVGDLVRLRNNEDVPADLVLLASSDPEGLCYVETANLDGETNLKVKYCHTVTAKFDRAEAFSRAGYFTVEAEAPNPRLYSFEGAICRWDIPPSLSLGLADGARGKTTAALPVRPGAGFGPDGTIGSYAMPFNEQVGLLSRDPLDAQNLLLRGCTLRKTEWIIGVIIFTGADTKVVRNMLPAPRKVTQLEKHMNRVVVLVLGLLGALALLLGLISVVWEGLNKDWYLGVPSGYPELPAGVGAFFIQVVRFVILMAQAVPISLYVTLETVKVLQCKVMFDSDLQMYHAAEDVAFTSRTTTLNEELGQVQYVLSDKTGTLTQNIMGFVWASVGGKLYGRGPVIQANPADLKGTSPADLVTAPDGVQFPLYTPHTLVLDAELRGVVHAGAAAVGTSSSRKDAPLFGKDAALDYMLGLALCNTVVPTATEDGQLLYQAASPDEEALVTGAAYLGIKLLGRSATGMEVEVGGRVQRFELLAVLEFNSDRKRMSVVVKDPAGRLRLLTKGADNVVLARLAPGAARLADVQAHLAEMSGAGFRTLVMAYKDLEAAAFDKWAAGYKAACAAMEGREQAVAACCELMETDLLLLGATAVEDKLQEGVPEAIAALKTAGVAVWVLTGDKMETAISIGYNCRLLNSSMQVLKINESDLQQLGSMGGAANPLPSAADSFQPNASGRAPIAAGLASRLFLFGRSDSGGGAIAANGSSSSYPAAPGSPRGGLGRDDVAARALRRLIATASTHGGGGAAVTAAGTGLVVDGGALAVVLQPQFEDQFLELCRACTAVICCRVSPMQKAQVTKLLKRKAGAVTLAIGDGANDVSMIQAAHIGVGISGREGRTAVQAADYAFGQFRFLVRLLLVHGRYSYLRCREVVLYAFYKNVAYVSCFVLFATYSAYSAQSVFFSLYIATFNALWAAFPTIAFGVFDQELPPATLLQYPQLYAETRTQTRWDFLKAWLLWVGLGLWHGICCFLVPLRALGGVNDLGHHLNVYEMGTAIMTSVIITVTLRVAVRTNYWTIFNHIATWTPLALWLPFLALLGGLCGSITGLAPLCGLLRDLMATGPYWLGAVILAPATALLLDFTIAVFQRAVAPRGSQLLQEYEALAARGKLPSPAIEAGIFAAGGTAAAHIPDVELQGSPTAAAAALARQQMVPAAPAAAAAAAGIGPATVQLGLAPAASLGRSGSSMGLAAGYGSAAAGRAHAAPHMMRTSSMAGWGQGGGIGMGYDTSFGGAGGGAATLGGFAAMEWSPSYVVAGPSALAASHTKRQAATPRPRGMVGPSGLTPQSPSQQQQQPEDTRQAFGQRWRQQQQQTLQMASLPAGPVAPGGPEAPPAGPGGDGWNVLPLGSEGSESPAGSPRAGGGRGQPDALPVSSSSSTASAAGLRSRGSRGLSPLGRGRGAGRRGPAPPAPQPEPSQYVPPQGDDALL